VIGAVVYFFTNEFFGIFSSITDQEHHLHRRLRLRDLVLSQILCVVGSSWVGVAAGLGRAQALTWIAAMIVFYVPMAASVICLNRVWPLEGGLYVWAHKAFGDVGVRHLDRGCYSLRHPD